MSGRAFCWLLAVVAFAAAMALLLASGQLMRLSQDAAAARQQVIAADLVRKLDGHAASAQMLQLVADGALLSLPADLVAAVIDTGGSILASSSASGRWDGEPSPARWLDTDGKIPLATWAASTAGTKLVGVPLHDPHGDSIGALVIEDSGTAIPLLVHILAPAALWGLLIFTALLPAGWFGTRLALGTLARDAAAAADMLTGLRVPATGQPLPALAPQSTFAAFGRATGGLLDQLHAAVAAASSSGDDDRAAPIGASAPIGNGTKPTQSSAAEATRATRRLLGLAACMALCVGGAMAIALVAGEQGKLADIRHTYAEALADVVVRSLDGASSLSPDQAAAVARDARQLFGFQGIAVEAVGPQQAGASRVVRRLAPGEVNGWQVSVTVDDTADADLTAVLGALLGGLAVGLWTALELLIWVMSRQLAAPLDMMEQLIAAGIAGDYRLVPPPGGAGEIGALNKALTRCIDFVTLLWRDVDLLLRDASRDTYDLGVVARAEAWSRWFQTRVRIAAGDPPPARMAADQGLQRLLWFLTALLLGLQFQLLNGRPAAILPMLLAVLSGGRLLARLPCWIGRRAAIALVGATAALTVWLVPLPGAALGACVLGLAAGAIMHSAGAGEAEPAGARGAARASAALTAAAGGLGCAALLAVVAGPELTRLAVALPPAGVGLIAAFAFTVRGPTLGPPARTVFPALADFTAALRVTPLAAVLLGSVLPAAVFVAAALLAALAQGMPAFCVVAAAAGLCAAPARCGSERQIALRPLAGAMLLLLTSSWQPVPTLLITAAAGCLAGMLWHHAAAALQDVAHHGRIVVPEQATLMCGAVWRGTGLLLPLGSVLLGIPPVAAVLILTIGSTAGPAIGYLRHGRPVAAA